MSPLVERKRVDRPSAPADQHWSLLLFESLSAGALAIAVGIAAVLLVISVFVVVVWPLTFWDGSTLRLENYSSWADTILWSIFVGGSLAGYWCFSGAAFKPKRKSQNSAIARRR